MRSTTPAAVLLTAAAFWLTGCSFGVPGTDQEVNVDSDGVSVGNEDGGITVESDGDVSIGDEDGGVTLDQDGGVSVDRETGALLVAAVEGGVTEECEGRDVEVTASGAEVVLNGRCGEVAILGDGLTVHVGTADSIRVTGARNTVHHAAGEPEVTDIGVDNTVSAGGDASG